MKTSIIVATSVLCCFAAGVGPYAWSEDLDAALESVSISSEAQNAPKRDDSNNLPCESKTPGASCPDSRHDDISANANQAANLQRSILSGQEQNVMINGAAVPEAPQATISVNGF
jgi:hypothetical protein